MYRFLGVQKPRIETKEKIVEVTKEINVNVMQLSASELDIFYKWYNKHKKKCPKIKEKGAVFTSLKFSASNCTGIGQGTEVECECGEKVDITDVSNW